jgi:hypothetical protein
VNARQGLRLIAGLFGFIATLVLYLVLLFIQNENADYACESPSAVPGIEVGDIRGIGFQNAFLNLGGRCEYRMDDGSVKVTREPGWWFSGTIAGIVALLATAAVLIVRRKGHLGMLFGLTTLIAPPLGIALAVATPRRAY